MMSHRCGPLLAILFALGCGAEGRQQPPGNIAATKSSPASAAAAAQPSPAWEADLGRFRAAEQEARQARATGDRAAEQGANRAAAGLAQSLLAEHRGQLAEDELRRLDAALFRGAVGHSSAGDHAPALELLRQAFDEGFDDLALLDGEADLAGVRALPEYAAFRAQQPGRIQTRARQQVIGKMTYFEPFPFDFSLTDLQGNDLALASWRGEIVVVTLGASWCPLCQRHASVLDALNQKYAERGVRIAGLYFQEPDDKDPASTVRSYLERAPLSYPGAIGTEDLARRVPNFYAYPSTLFIDRSGNVRLKLDGEQGALHLEAAILELLES